MQPEKDELFSVDARPSDAINVAYRCQVCIFKAGDFFMLTQCKSASFLSIDVGKMESFHHHSNVFCYWETHIY